MLTVFSLSKLLKMKGIHNLRSLLSGFSATVFSLSKLLKMKGIHNAF